MPARESLAPAGASTLRLCRYAGLNARPRFALTWSRLLRSRRLVSALVRDLDRLQRFPPGLVNCPEDDLSQIEVLLAYPGGRVLTISVGLTGCRAVTNGSVARTALGFGSPPPMVGPELLGTLERLTVGGHARNAQQRAALPSNPHVKLLRQSGPLWCPMGDKRFDARALLGLPEPRAKAIIVQHGCTWLVNERNGHSFIVPSDLVSIRVDLSIDRGVITAVNVG